MPVVVSSALETGVGLAAELALAGALPRLELACGLGTLALLAGDVTPAAPAAGPGRLPVPERPPVPDPELLERYAVRDPERVRWWRERTLRTHARLRALLRDAEAPGSA
jgi:O-succinylbenzoate synthase